MIQKVSMRIKNKDKDEDIYEDEEEERSQKIKVFDRFTMILQIFAKRARNRVARLQVS